MIPKHILLGELSNLVCKPRNSKGGIESLFDPPC